MRRLTLILCRGIYWGTYLYKSPFRQHVFQCYWFAVFLQSYSSDINWPAELLLEISYFQKTASTIGTWTIQLGICNLTPFSPLTERKVLVFCLGLLTFQSPYSHFLKLKGAPAAICCSFGHVDDFPHVLLSWPRAPGATTGSDEEAAGRQMDSQRTSKKLPHEQILPFPLSISNGIS